MELNDVIKFANDRHDLWAGKPVTSPILTQRKFTNVFRLIDRGSQYLLNMMNLYEDPLDQLALSYFYRQVNRPDTMDAIIAANDGFVPEASDIFNPEWYDRVVGPVAQARPGAFLSGAYMILIKPGDSRGTVAKMQAVFPAAKPHLEQVSRLIFLDSRVKALQKTPGLGPFMAMQVATDLGYCEGQQDQENTFILAGPGSRKGVKFISDAKAETIIKDFPVDQLPPLPGSNGRTASWMDIQNVFCEFSKYARLLERGYTSTGKPYQRHGKYKMTVPTHFIQ